MKRDNLRGIFFRDWKADSPRAVLLLVHGLNAHSARWEFLSRFFLQHGISSYAIELRGYGQAKADEANPALFKTYSRDIKSLYGIIREENPDKKVFLVGESMGAVISFLLAADEPGLFAGLIAISPALKSALKLTFPDYLDIFLPLIYNPNKLNKLPFDHTACTRDPDYLKVIEEEHAETPLATSRLLFDIVVGQLRCRFLKDKIKAPLLFLIAGKDTIMVPEAGKNFFKALKLKDKTLIEYPEMYHAISIELGREKAFDDILKWLEKRI